MSRQLFFLAIYRMDKFIFVIYTRDICKQNTTPLTNQLANIRVHSSITWWLFSTLFGERPQMVSTVGWTILRHEDIPGKPYLSP